MLPSGLGVGLEGADGRVHLAGEVGSSHGIGSSDGPSSDGAGSGLWSVLQREARKGLAESEYVSGLGVSVRWEVHTQASWNDGSCGQEARDPKVTF